MSNRAKNILWTVLIIGAFLLLIRVRGDSGIKVNFGEDTLTLTGPQQYTCLVDYDKIQSIELVDLSDLGTAVNGGENRYYLWGDYQNEHWGAYRLCISKEINNALLIVLQDEAPVVFNHEKEETTAAILDMFRELLANR